MKMKIIINHHAVYVEIITGFYRHIYWTSLLFWGYLYFKR